MPCGDLAEVERCTERGLEAVHPRQTRIRKVRAHAWLPVDPASLTEPKEQRECLTRLRREEMRGPN
jgi:hypothetical protein